MMTTHRIVKPKPSDTIPHPKPKRTDNSTHIHTGVKKMEEKFQLVFTQSDSAPHLPFYLYSLTLTLTNPPQTTLLFIPTASLLFLAFLFCRFLSPFVFLPLAFALFVFLLLIARKLDEALAPLQVDIGIRNIVKMDQSQVPQLEGIGVTTRKRRSQTLRRPRPEAQSNPDQSPKSSTPVSDDLSIASSDENMPGGSSGLKMFNLNQCVSRSLSVSGSDSRSNMVLSNGKSEGAGSENNLKKVKLKVGGVTRTIQTKSNSTGPPGRGSMESSDEYLSPRLDKRTALQGIPWKESSSGSFGIEREDMGRTSTRNALEKLEEKPDSVRKSKRMPKKRVLDGEFDKYDEDDEIRYLEKLKTTKMAGYKDSEAQSTRKQKGVRHDNTENVGKQRRDSRKSRFVDMDYEEEDSLSDEEPEGKKSKKLKKDLAELPESKREMALTTRQRALLSKDSPATGAGQIEFPNGLPPAPPRKQREKLSEVEQQLKKAEAAERRKLQNEKAARESEAEAIRKILGQDSSRKKREEKMKKRQEELSKEKATNAQMLSSNTIRTVMGPSGTTVTFPQEIGFPKIFDAKPYSYPPPREKCAGPFCTNAYKYRDSKSNLPLCSLQCYKAITEKIQTKVC